MRAESMLNLSWIHNGPATDCGLGFYPLLLQLSDGILCFLEALAGRGALLPHHRQLPLDHVVLLRFLGPCDLTLEQSIRTDQLSSLNLESSRPTRMYCSSGGLLNVNGQMVSGEIVRGWSLWESAEMIDGTNVKMKINEDTIPGNPCMFIVLKELNKQHIMSH